MADALDHAHHAGVVHLDVKPENLLLTSETVKVADFGLVRAAAQRGHGQALAATVHYCAPEVLRGGVVDGRADVYALGVVAWECVSGRPPFEGDARQVVQQHLGGRVPPPSRVAGEIAEPFDVAVLRATDPDPTRRYLRASDFAAAIGAPRRRRVDEALRATTLLPTGGDTTAAWAAAAESTAAGAGASGGGGAGAAEAAAGAATVAGAPATGWPPEHGGAGAETRSLEGGRRWRAVRPGCRRPPRRSCGHGRPPGGCPRRGPSGRQGQQGRLLAVLLVVGLLAAGLLTRAGGLLGGSVRVPEVVGL